MEIKGIFIRKRHWDQGMRLVLVPVLCYTEK